MELPSPALPSSPFKESLWLLPPPPHPLPLQLDSTGITRGDPSYRIRRPHGGRYHVLEYIIAGSGHLYIDGAHYQPQTGDLYLLPPGVPHEYYNRRDRPWQKIWFNISGKFVTGLTEIYGFPGTVFLSGCPLENEFRSGMETVRRGEADAYIKLSAILTTIFATMHQYRADKVMGHSPEGVILKAYLDAHWHEPVSLRTLADAIGKSEAQMLRIFRRDFATTPGAYQQARKLTLAREYLDNTPCTLRMLAERLGFGNEFHLSSWFKQKTGLSPRNYRNRHL